VPNGPLCIFPNINPFEMNSWKICLLQPEIANVIINVEEGGEGEKEAILEAFFR